MLRLGSQWMWESRLRAGDLGEAFGARSVQRPLEDESGGGPRPTPSSCPSRGGGSIRAPPRSLVGDKRGHGRGEQREGEGMIDLSVLGSRSQDSAPVLPGKESGRRDNSGGSYVWNLTDVHTTTHLCDGDKRILLVWN